MKKTLALMLALVLVLSLAACVGDNTPTTQPSTEPTTDPTTEPTTEPTLPYDPVDDGNVNYDDNTVNAGSLTTNLQNTAGGGEVGYDVFAGQAGKDYTDPETYTYNSYIGGTTGMKWSTHTWETADDSTILDYISSGFYTFNLNATATGWSISCEMADELPVDVTADYVGQFGITEGQTGRAWKISLNELAAWEDGTPINADTYVYSYQELLDPLMKNRRADSLYAGDFVIVGAKEYFYAGQKVYANANSTDGETMTYAWADLVRGEDGVYTAPDGTAIAFGLETGYAWMGGYSLTDYYDAGYIPDADCWDVLSAAADDDGFVEITDETIAALYLFTGSDVWGNETQDQLGFYVSIEYTYPEYAWEDVGIVKTGDYELVFITDSPIEDPNYYVPYNLSSTYLVYESLWESCKSYFDADGNSVSANAGTAVRVTTNYATNVATTKSYGPYKLSYFEQDKQFTLVRNDEWFGYKDNKHLGQYQTDIISTQVITEHATAMLAFLAGEIDSVGLQQADMTQYASSAYIRYSPQSYTTKLTFNTDLDSLESRGSQILANAHFRKAFSLAIDRTTFAASYTTSTPGYGLLNEMYVYDPFTGASYRATEGAMAAIVDLYGLTYGEDGDYGSLEEAYEAVTGYDLALAQQLMTQAYYEAVEDDLYDGESNISLQISVYSSDDIYVQMFNYLNTALQNACTGTPLEGKVSLTMVADADYYETMYSGGTDIIFTTWGGAAYSPYTMLNQCYCDAADGSGQQMEYGFETNDVMVTMTVDGVDYVASLHDWAYWAGGDLSYTITSADGESTLENFAAYDADTRATFFGKLENAYLSFYATTPMYYRTSASLISQKGDYAVQSYVDLVGFGGIQFYTYNYTDAQWAEVAGTLTY